MNLKHFRNCFVISMWIIAPGIFLYAMSDSATEISIDSIRPNNVAEINSHTIKKRSVYIKPSYSMNYSDWKLRGWQLEVGYLGNSYYGFSFCYSEEITSFSKYGMDESHFRSFLGCGLIWEYFNALVNKKK